MGIRRIKRAGSDNLSSGTQTKKGSRQRIGTGLQPKHLIIASLGIFAIFFIIALLNTAIKKQSKSKPGAKAETEVVPEPEKKDKHGESYDPVSELSKGVVFIMNTQKGVSGSGFLISRKGEILTNEHVISGADQVNVLFHDNKIHTASIIRSDAETDLALIQCEAIPTDNYIFILSGAEEKTGTAVLVMGFPLGSELGTEITVTDGLLSAVRKYGGDQAVWYQTSAAVNPGNSGGPMVKKETKEVIGIVTAKHLEGENIGLARPSYVVIDKFLRKVARKN